jgi:hypothetical protein
MVTVDVLTLLAPGESVPDPAVRALARQGAMRLVAHQVVGRGAPGEDRVQTIARARNAARALGDAPYVLFLDRDVVLPDAGIEHLLIGLFANPQYAALGINYQDPVAGPAIHVAMGCTLFYRSILERLEFRTVPGRCECLCCCEDIRRMGYRIDYLPGLRAEHLKPRWSAVRGAA